MDSLRQLETVILVVIAVLAQTTVERTLIPYPILPGLAHRCWY